MMALDWSVLLGIAVGLGLPGLGGLFFLVRMESRVTTLETTARDDRDVDVRWKACVDQKLTTIARDLNRLIGARDMEEG